MGKLPTYIQIFVRSNYNPVLTKSKYVPPVLSENDLMWLSAFFNHCTDDLLKFVVTDMYA